MKSVNLPTSLTLVRLILSPLLLPFFLVYFLPYNFLPLNIVLGVVFVLFGLTDFLDGFLARKYNQETDIGRMLDPIADKFLLFSTFISLLAIDRIYFYWVILLIGREFFMMSIRLIAVSHNFSVPVTYLAKVKTAVQMVYLTVLIVNPYHHATVFDAPWINVCEYALLLAMLVIVYVTTKHYFDSFMTQYKKYKTLQHGE